MTQPSPQHNLPEYTVSEIAGALKRTVEDKFSYVRVRGEISGWRGPHSSGHGYFKLKDDNAVLDAVCWRGSLAKLGCKLEEGLEVIASGRITTYPGKSSYQIVVERMEPAGMGALMALLEKRKAALAAEGLFAPERKRALPFMPLTIGVITSPTGAVIRDILHRLQDRFPCRVLVWPVLVQGEGAAEQVAAAIQGFHGCDARMRPDVLIVARGGGSIEDLWAFNEEIVVRAVANCAIPVISAIGHETDTTLIDYVSDRRAPTPTAAAEMAVPVLSELLLGMQQMDHRLSAAIFRTLTAQSDRLQGLARGLPKPAQLIETNTQRLDDWSERLAKSLPVLLEKRAQQLAVTSASLRPQLLVNDVNEWSRKLTDLSARLAAPTLRLIDQKRQKLELTARMLASLSYESVLKRGFALVKNQEGSLITGVEAARQAETLNVTFHDGNVTLHCQKST